MWLFRDMLFYQINKFVVNIYFFIFDKMSSRAGWNGFPSRIWPAGRSFETLSYKIRRDVSAGLRCHCRIVILNLSWFSWWLQLLSFLPLILFYVFRTTWISSAVVNVSILLFSVHVYLLISLRIGLPYIHQKKGGLTPVTLLTIIYT